MECTDVGHKAWMTCWMWLKAVLEFRMVWLLTVEELVDLCRLQHYSGREKKRETVPPGLYFFWIILGLADVCLCIGLQVSEFLQTFWSTKSASPPLLQPADPSIPPSLPHLRYRFAHSSLPALFSLFFATHTHRLRHTHTHTTFLPTHIHAQIHKDIHT